MSRHKAYRNSLNGQWTALKRRAKKRRMPLEMTFEEYAVLRRKPCHYCGSALPASGTGLDRKDSAEAYAVWNCLPCCTRCNLVKSIYLTPRQMKRVVKLLGWRKK